MEGFRQGGDPGGEGTRTSLFPHFLVPRNSVSGFRRMGAAADRVLGCKSPVEQGLGHLQGLRPCFLRASAQRCRCCIVVVIALRADSITLQKNHSNLYR